MEEDEILESLRKKSREGDLEAVKTLIEYEKAKKYTYLIKGLDDDESTGETTFPNQFQLN